MELLSLAVAGARGADLLCTIDAKLAVGRPRVPGLNAVAEPAAVPLLTAGATINATVKRQ